VITDLKGRLASFNRKERFLLVGQSLGNPAFVLGSDFRERLGALLGRPVPEDAYCAMDYHLDWLYASLMWATGQVHPGNLMPRIPDLGLDPPRDLKVTGNQSDVDLLVAWVDERDRAQVVMLEAKGFSAWTHKQMAYKSARLVAIFGDESNVRFPGVDAHLVLVGPKTVPSELLAGGPSWAVGRTTGNVKYFLTLNPPSAETYAVQRVTADRQPSSVGSHWIIKSAPWPKANDDEVNKPPA
jgi:hypothetical protein